MAHSIAGTPPTRRPTFGRFLAAVAVVGASLAVTGCGGGVDVVVEAPPPPPPTALGIGLSRVGYESVRVDWSDDPDVYQFTVERDGGTLANVMATSLIDNSVTTRVQYCYRVLGYSFHGDLIALSDSTCIVLAP